MTASTNRIKEYLTRFNIAGFTYYDGPEVFKELEVGLLLNLEPEPDNPVDLRAIKICYKGFLLGYIPRSENKIFYKLLRVGFHNIELRVQQVDPTAFPEDQIMVVAHLVN